MERKRIPMIKLSQLILSCSNCGWVGRTINVKLTQRGDKATIACPECFEDKDYNFGHTFFVATKKDIKMFPEQFGKKKFAYRLN